MNRAQLHHIAITVTDLEASVAWYEEVFDVKAKMDIPHAGGTSRLLADYAFSLVIVLHRHDTNDGGLFREQATGLDHVGFRLPTRADLVAWQEHLESKGVVLADAADKPSTQSSIADEAYGSVLVFRDPDNIQLELSSPHGA